MTSYAIVGTGAVGGYYGALLQRSGQDVHFLLRSDFEAVRDQGLRVESPRGDFRLPTVKAYASAADMPRCDGVVVAWKTTENAHLASVLPYLVKPGGVVLVLQNGLDPEREVAPHADGASILSGLCFLCCRKEGPGHIVHQDYGAITLAAYGGGENMVVSEAGTVAAGGGAALGVGVTPEMVSVAEDLELAGIEVRKHENWRAARWRKLVWNVPFNGLCALRGADTREILSLPGGREEVKGLMEEVIAGAALNGCALSEGFADRMVEDTEKMIAYEPSMKLDLDHGRPMELEAIYRRPLEAIRKAGGRAPRMEALLADLEKASAQPANRL
jgi:2-dehydropantoate 2-reductase